MLLHPNLICYQHQFAKENEGLKGKQKDWKAQKKSCGNLTKPFNEADETALANLWLAFPCRIY